MLSRELPSKSFGVIALMDNNVFIPAIADLDGDGEHVLGLPPLSVINAACGTESSTKWGSLIRLLSTKVMGQVSIVYHLRLELALIVGATSWAHQMAVVTTSRHHDWTHILNVWLSWGACNWILKVLNRIFLKICGQSKRLKKSLLVLWWWWLNPLVLISCLR